MTLKNYLIIFFLCIHCLQSKADNPPGAKALEKPNPPNRHYELAIQQLDQDTPIKLEYNNIIRNVIDIYVSKRPEHTATILGRSSLYFPLFEEKLSKYNLPLELKYLAVIESALDPLAVSSSGATGLWQFLYQSSRMFDLKINSYEDERCDPEKSTEAACKYLRYLYWIFNDWQLAISAYNCGPGEIERAIERSGGKVSYWELRPYLPREAQSYYPAFVAATYSLNFYQKHHITPAKPEFKFEEMGQIEIAQSIYFRQLTDVLGIPETTLRKLNPKYKKDYVPVKQEKIPLLVPKDFVRLFYRHEQEIYKHPVAFKNYNDLKKETGKKEGRKAITYIVKPGEFFHKIAIEHGCTISDIMKWNKMKDRNIQEGQNLVIWIDNQGEQKELRPRLKGNTTPPLLSISDFNKKNKTDLLIAKTQ